MRVADMAVPNAPFGTAGIVAMGARFDQEVRPAWPSR
jgi:hypothetical protein